MKKIPRAEPTYSSDVSESASVPEQDFFGFSDIWNPEVMQTQSVAPEGTGFVGTNESWIELSWNLTRKFAWFTLYGAESSTAVECWQYCIEIPEMPYEADVDIVRHLTARQAFVLV